jgi:SRSO17 transposase
MSGRPTREQVMAWADEVGAVGERIGGRFARSEPRRRAVGYVRGLLSGAERKNGWQLAEHLGDPTPDGVQYLLARADWAADAVRDDLVGYVVEHLADPDGVLVVDETGFLKKGTKSVGVARQYGGTAGRIENCQVGVFLGYAAKKGRALVDRTLYLPKEWTSDAGVPEEVAFATKIVLARRMIDRAVAAGLPAKWVTADSVYGSNHHFRTAVEGHGQGTWSGCGRTSPSARGSGRCGSGRCSSTCRPTAGTG